MRPASEHSSAVAKDPSHPALSAKAVAKSEACAAVDANALATLGTNPNLSCSTLRKLLPQAKLPGPASLVGFSPAEVELLKRRIAEPAEFIEYESFAKLESETLLMRPIVQPVRKRAGARIDDSGVFNLPDAASPQLTPEQHMFLKLNYCRYRVARVLEDFSGKRLSAEAARELLRWELRAEEARCDVVRANVPLVLAMSKRTRITGADIADLISEGNLALLRSVDKFDCARGFKFSTYACRAILKAFSRVAARAARMRGYFPTEYDPTLEKSDYVERRRDDFELECVDELKAILISNRANLSEIERRVLAARFALDEPASDPAAKARTLEQVGALIGVTKERVRQIQNKALTKLRVMLEQGVLAR